MTGKKSRGRGSLDIKNINDNQGSNFNLNVQSMIETIVILYVKLNIERKCLEGLKPMLSK